MESVIVVNYTGRRGGGPLNAFEMTKALLENGNAVIAVISDKCENLEQWKTLALKKLILINTYSTIQTLIYKTFIFTIIGNKQLKHLSENYKIDYIYCPMVTLWTSVINYKIGSKFRTCVVNHDPISHDGDKGSILLNFFGMQRVYRSADMVIVHSKKFVDYLEKKYEKPGCVNYIPLGRHDYYKKFENKKYYVNYDANKVNFLFFGRVEKYKGVNVLIAAYKRVLENCKNITLTIAGNGNCLEYKAQIKELGIYLENRWLDDFEVGTFFNGPNVVLVLPYISATQSGPVLIALDYHIPVICSDVGGLAEQVLDGKTGFLVPANDEIKLAKAMILLANDISVRDKLIQGMNERLEELDWKNLAFSLAKYMSK